MLRAVCQPQQVTTAAQACFVIEILWHSRLYVSRIPGATSMKEVNSQVIGVIAPIASQS
jgi:hypothetical protein